MPVGLLAIWRQIHALKWVWDRGLVSDACERWFSAVTHLRW